MRWIRALGILPLLLAPPGAGLAKTADEAPAAKARPEAAASAEDRGTRVRLGGVSVGAGYSYFSGYPYFGFPYPHWHHWTAHELLYYPSYGWLGGFVHPGYYRGYRQGDGMGLVKLRTADKQAQVFLDDGYAGMAKDLKNIWLRPGAYNIEVRADSESFRQRIYVLSGKTVRIEAELTPIEENQP